MLSHTTHLGILLLPYFNAMATMALLDPLRAANYLRGQPLYVWDFLSLDGNPVYASNGLQISATQAIDNARRDYQMALVSSSWTPEAHRDPRITAWLRGCARHGAVLGGLDTGAFLLAYAGLLAGRTVTVHYEHIAAFKELFPAIPVTENLYVMDRDRISCCGGAAASDLALEILRTQHGIDVANGAARYIFHERLRGPEAQQFPAQQEPVGSHVPEKLRKAIVCMERHLENPLPLSAIAAQVALSQRQLERLFRRHTGVTPVQYYQEVRLDRARGMVTQTELSLLEVAVACGFASQEYFARAYRKRFGLQPSQDRREGRIPFQFRSFPSHHQVS